VGISFPHQTQHGFETWEARVLVRLPACHWNVGTGLVEKLIQPYSHVFAKAGRLAFETHADSDLPNDVKAVGKSAPRAVNGRE
jgi:hypothetical protein